MKKIILIIFVFVSLSAKAQFDDSTSSIILTKRMLGMVEVTSFPFGITNDSIFGLIRNGKYYIRDNYQSSSFNSTSLGIFADGTDQTAYINKCFAHPFIKEIIFDARGGGGDIVVNGTLHGQNKTGTFIYGTKFTGTGTITNIYLKADERNYILKTTLTWGANVKSTTSEFSPMWFGVHPDSTGTANMPKLQYIVAATNTYPGMTIRFPEGRFWVKRVNNKIIQVYSKTKWFGRGDQSTFITLDTTDRKEFRRIFDVVPASTDMEIAYMAIRGSNIWSRRDSLPDEFNDDPQSAAIFAYSNSTPIRGLKVHDVDIRDMTGDGIGISQNTRDVTITNSTFQNCLRISMSIGGDDTLDNILVDRCVFKKKTLEHGEDFHIEPFGICRGITFSNSQLETMSFSGTVASTIDNIDITGTGTVNCNQNTNITIKNSRWLVGTVRVTFLGGDNRIVNNTGMQFRLGTSSGGNATPPNTIVESNTFNSTTGNALEIEAIRGVILRNNNVTADSAHGIYANNCWYTDIVGNTVKVNKGNWDGIRVRSTTSANANRGFDYIDGNTVTTPYRGIEIIDKAAIIGTNILNAPTPIQNGGIIFPFKDGSGKRILNSTGTTMVNYGQWDKGDIVTLKKSTGISTYVCDTTGALYQENWRPASTYYTNAFVRDSTNGRIYQAIAPGGQAELPSSDSDNTYWMQVATRVATFVPAGGGGFSYEGNGSPEGITAFASARPGDIYHRRDGDSCTSGYIKTTMAGVATGWRAFGCGGSGGGLTQQEVQDLIDASIDGYDTLAVNVYQNATRDSTIFEYGTLRLAVKDSTGGINDGDKGDITVASSGASMTVDNGAINNNKVASGIDAAKINTGVVSNTEYNYLDGVTSGIQTQLSGKVGTSRTLTINGNTYDLSSDRSWTIPGISDGDKGDVTVASSGASITIDNNAVTTGKVNDNAITYAKLQQGTARSLLGVTGNSAANYAPIQGTANQVARINSAGTSLDFGPINLASSNAVTGILPIENIDTAKLVKNQKSYRQDAYAAIRSLWADSLLLSDGTGTTSTNTFNMTYDGTGQKWRINFGSTLQGGWSTLGGFIFPTRSSSLSANSNTQGSTYFNTTNFHLEHVQPGLFQVQKIAYFSDVPQPFLQRIGVSRQLNPIVSSSDFTTLWFKTFPGESHTLADSGITIKGSANNYANYVRNNFTGTSQNYTSRAQFQVYYSGSAKDTGITMGTYSTQLIAREVGFRFSYGTKKLYLVTNYINSINYLDSSVAIDYSPGHIFDMYIVQNVNTIQCYLYNRNTAKSITLHRTIRYPASSPENLNNFGYVQAFFHHGGHTRLISLIHEINDRKEPDILFLMDSNGQFILGSPQEYSAPNLIAKSTGLYCINGSGGGNAASVASRPEYNLQKPKYVVYGLGTNNDIINDDSATFRNKISTDIAYLKNSTNNPDLVKIILLTVPPMTGSDVGMYNNTIYSLFSADSKIQIVDRFNILKASGSNDLDAQYDVGDGIHYNAAAHRKVAGAILSAFPAFVANSISVSDPETSAGNGNASAGTWTPTLGNVANFTSGTVRHCSYQAIDNIVTISGVMDVVITGATTIQFYLTLPPGQTSNFSQSYDAHGTVDVDGSAAQQTSGYVFADDTNDRIVISFVAGDSGSQQVQFTIQYEKK